MSQELDALLRKRLTAYEYEMLFKPFVAALRAEHAPTAKFRTHCPSGKPCGAVTTGCYEHCQSERPATPLSHTEPELLHRPTVARVPPVYATSAASSTVASDIEELAKDAEYAQSCVLEHNIHIVELKTLARRIRALSATATLTDSPKENT